MQRKTSCRASECTIADHDSMRKLTHTIKQSNNKAKKRRRKKGKKTKTLHLSLKSFPIRVVEWKLCRSHFVHHHPQRPPIDHLILRLFLRELKENKQQRQQTAHISHNCPILRHHFRRNKLRRSTQRKRALRHDNFGETKVGKTSMALI